MSLDALMTEIKGLKDTVEKTASEVDSLKKAHSASGATPAQVFGASHVRKGEDPLSSRGYSFVKLIGCMAGVLTKDEAKVEVDLHNRLYEAYCAGGKYVKAEANSILAPFSSQHLSHHLDQKLAREVGEVVRAGVTGYDAEEVRALRSKHWGRQKAMSWVDDPSGGALVGPPMMGELIDILRNNEVLMKAGARDIGMPPSGRITFPRQTDVSTAYWVGESATITESQPKAGDVVLTAKKLAALVRIPNELFRFASIGVEQFVREDLSRVLVLRMDKSLLESPGSSVEPKGLINYAGITAFTPAKVAADGNTLGATDPYDMIAALEEKNAEFKSWIMRPTMYGKIRNRRADSVATGDANGPFLFDVWRESGQDIGTDRLSTGNLSGYPVHKSTQVSNARAKGASTNLSYVLGGDFSDYVIAMGGVIEFAVSPYGDTAFSQDQTVLRAIHYCDGAPRREASFVWADNLYVA